MQRNLAFMIFTAFALFSSVGEVQAQDANAEANKLFVEAVTLYRQSEAATDGAKSEAYARVRVLFDQILSDYPDSRPAKVIAQGGSPGGVSIASLPTYKPKGWNDGKRNLTAQLLESFGGDRTRLSAVAASYEWAILACAAYSGDGLVCRDEITGGGDVLPGEIGWTPGEPIIGDYLGVGQAVAYLYQHEGGRAALVYRGSDEWQDFVTNILGTADPSFLNAAQLRFAVELAEDAVAKHPNITFVGHSLGGRLAQISTLSTGRPAVVFNSAPLGSWETIRYAQTFERRSELVTRLRGPDDPVSILGTQKASEQIEVSNLVRTGDGLVKNLAGAALQGYSHSMSPLAGAVQRVHEAESFGWVSAYLDEQKSDVSDSGGTDSVATRSVEFVFPRPRLDRVARLSDDGELRSTGFNVDISDELSVNCTHWVTQGAGAASEYGITTWEALVPKLQCNVWSDNGDGSSGLVRGVGVSATYSEDTGALTMALLDPNTFHSARTQQNDTCDFSVQNQDFEHKDSWVAECPSTSNNVAEEILAESGETGHFEPERGTDLRKSILDSVRPIAEHHFGSPVEFIVDTMRVLDDQAYVELSAQRPGGVEIDLAATPAAARGEVDFGVGNGNVVSGFLVKQAGEWKPRDIVVQATEAWWIEDCTGLGRLMPETCADSDQTPPINTGTAEVLSEDVPLLTGIYVNDPTACQSPKVTPEIFDRIMYLNPNYVGRMDTECSVRSATTQGDEAKINASCNAEGEKRDVAWTWNIEGNARFAQSGTGWRDVWTRCEPDSPLVKFHSDDGELVTATNSVQIAGQTCIPSGRPMFPQRMMPEEDSSTHSGRTMSGKNWTLRLFSPGSAFGVAEFTNSAGATAEGFWRPTSSGICQSYNGRESWSCHDLFACEGHADRFAMRNSAGEITSVLTASVGPSYEQGTATTEQPGYATRVPDPESSSIRNIEVERRILSCGRIGQFYSRLNCLKGVNYE